MVIENLAYTKTPGNKVQNFKWKLDYPYIPCQELVEAVNLAIRLQMPLLLEGAPGCGKTQLASDIAATFTHNYLSGQTDEEGNPKWWDFHIWNVKSASRGQDGLYTFDAIARLRDAQLAGYRRRALVRNPKLYREFGPLGNAILNTYHNTKYDPNMRSIVLIDEIDKADSDLPNDLLQIFDSFSFKVSETGEDVPPIDSDIQFKAPPPIIIITSNRERSLPDPFLRRCLYFYVGFPTSEELLKIIEARFGKKNAKQKKFVNATLDELERIQALLNDRPGSRPPGTGEILKFIEELWGKETALEELKNLANRTPLLGILLKTQADQELYREASIGADDE